MGKCGVSVSSLADMETLLEGLPLDRVTTSMTINSPAAMIWAMYLVAVEKRGIDWKKISGTTQNDILKEYIAQKEYIFPPKPSMRLVVDTIEFGTRHTPALEYGFPQRLSHPRGRLDRPARVGVHSERRHGIRPMVGGPRAWRLTTLLPG